MHKVLILIKDIGVIVVIEDVDKTFDGEDIYPGEKVMTIHL